MEDKDTHQKIFEDTKERAHYLANIIWASPGFMYIKDVNSRYVACNENFAQAAGVNSPEDIVGKTDYDLAWGATEAHTLRTGDMDVLAGTANINFEETQLQSDGRYRTLLANKIPLYDEHHHVIGIYGNYFDITERKKQEKELLEAKQLAEEANRIKSEFVANISHDLRTPLSAILGMTDAALNSKDPAVHQETLEGVLESGKNLLHLIEDILNYASIEHQQHKAEHTTFCLDELINGIRLATEPNAHKKGLDIIIENQCDDNQYLLADKKSIRRIIVNLIGNAIKFTEKGNIRLTLYPGAPSELCPGLMTLNVAIKDTGIGMEKKYLGKIFDRFSRLSPTYTTKHTSSGLGLTIVQQLLLQMHGTIHVESELGIGTTFLCSIPLQFMSAPVTTNNKPEENEDTTIPENQRRTINILVVEDSQPVRRAMDMLLKHLGGRVTFATSGEEAIATPINNFDIVFMDLGLGDSTGTAVTKTLRKKYGKQTPIVALTAHAQERDRQECLAAGMDDFITKPILLETLKKLLKSFNLY